MLPNLIRAFAVAAMIAAMPAMAGPLTLTAADPIATVTIPDEWSGKKITRGLEIKTPDEEVYLWFELIAPGEIDSVQKEHNTYFEKEGVTVTGVSETKKTEVNGRAWSFTELAATNKDGPSIIRYVAINPNLASGKIILMTYWASPEGDKTHDAAMTKLIDGISFK